MAESLETIAKTSYNAAFDIPERDSADYRTNFVKQMLAPSSGCLLDLGCNYGSFLTHLQKEDAIGLDLRREPLVVFKNYSRGQYPLLQGSAVDLPFANHVFDAITLWDVIEHVPEGTELLLLREISRVLKRGGLLFGTTPTDDLRSIITDPAFILRRHRHYSSAELEALLRLAGFEIQILQSLGDISAIFAINFLYLRKWAVRRKMLESVQSALDRKSQEKIVAGTSGYIGWYFLAKKK